MADYYQVLGLSEGASPEEIKRAYFKLIRSHSPEKDPEAFARIREAYEQLKDGGPQQNTIRFEIPADKLAQLIVNQLDRCFEQYDMELARDTAEEAVMRYPAVRFFRFKLVQAQLACGNTGNAVRNAEQLVRQEPDNIHFWKLYATACVERGFLKKADQAYRRLYALDCRDLDYIMDYARNLMDLKQEAKASLLLRDLLYGDSSWKSSQLQQVGEAYLMLLSLYIQESPDILAGMLEKYRIFIERYGAQLKDSLPEYASVIAMDFLKRKTFEIDNIGLFCGLFAAFDEAAAGSAHKEYLWTMRFLIEGAAMARDNALTLALKYFASYCTFKKTNSEASYEYLHFFQADCRLCALSEREQVLAQEQQVSRKYPAVYEEISGFLHLLRDPQRAEQQRRDFFDDLQRNGNPIDSFFCKDHREEFDKLYGKRIADGSMTFVREAKKIGRNDPCPCGSGKKYKNCCMRLAK